MKNEIEKHIFEKMKAKDFGESMCDETKLNVLKWTIKQLHIHNFGDSFSADKLKEAYTDGFSDSRYDFDTENYR